MSPEAINRTTDMRKRTIISEISSSKNKILKQPKHTQLFYNMVKGDTPRLFKWWSTRQATTIYEMQISSLLPGVVLPYIKIHFFHPLFISGIIYPNISEIHLVKSRVKTYYSNPVKPHQYFSFESRLASILHTPLRQNCIVQFGS
jgi:hypothetical protein